MKTHKLIVTMHAAYIELPLFIETWVPFTNFTNIKSPRPNDAIFIYPTLLSLKQQTATLGLCSCSVLCRRDSKCC